MRTPWRSRATSVVATLVWDTVVCTHCEQQYIRPESASDPCPYCVAVGKA